MDELLLPLDEILSNLPQGFDGAINTPIAALAGIKAPSVARENDDLARGRDLGVMRLQDICDVWRQRYLHFSHTLVKSASRLSDQTPNVDLEIVRSCRWYARAHRPNENKMSYRRSTARHVPVVARWWWSASTWRDVWSRLALSHG
jgi:hypothetical protein